MASRYQWISWHQPTDDHRPLTYPPNNRILGWWCTGHSSARNASTLCALVLAGDEGAAQAAVLKDWPEATDWRFCEPRNELTLSDRFPLQDWMEQRILYEVAR